MSTGSARADTGRVERRTAAEDGFTLIEVLVAIFVLVVAVLGVASLLSTSYISTKSTTSREQATNVARDVLERSRQVDYTVTTTSTIGPSVRGRLPDAAGAGTGSPFTINRRNTDYTVAVSSCSIDDPSDGAGVGDDSFCANPTGTPVPGSPASGNAVGANVLGISVNLGGSLLNTVCNAVGTNNAILNRLSAGLAPVAPTSVCPLTSSGTVAYDRRPDDLRRVSVTVTWEDQGRTRTLTQVALLTNPLANDCPLVTGTPLPAGCPTPIS